MTSSNLLDLEEALMDWSSSSWVK